MLVWISSISNFDFKTFNSEHNNGLKVFKFNMYVPIKDKFGTGISFLNVDNGFLKEKLFNVNLSEKANLRIGVKSGISTLKIDNSSFVLPNGEIGIDPLLNSPIEKESNFRLGFGTYLTMSKFSVGISIPNIIDAKKYGNNIKELALFLAYKYKINDTFYFEPMGKLNLSLSGNDSFNYYIAGNLEVKNIIGIGINYKSLVNKNFDNSNSIGI